MRPTTITTTLLTALLATAGPATAGSTLAMKGNGTATVEFQQMDHADGSKSQLIKSHLIQTIVEGDRKGETMGGDCFGFGRVGADGVYGGVLDCTYRLSAEDGYSIRMDDDHAEGGTFTVTGGTGAFKGATGKGSYTYTWGDTVYGDKLTWTAETTIALP
jgi:hypothetical protein